MRYLTQRSRNAVRRERLDHGGTPTSESHRFEVTLSDGHQVSAIMRWPRDLTGLAPTVLFSHGTGGSEFSALGQADEFLRGGYCIITWAFRGQGDSINLNAADDGGLFNLTDREALDAVEVIEACDAKYPGVIDTAKLFATGTSQGSSVAMAMAALSGLNPSAVMPDAVTAGWRGGSDTFPTFLAVAGFTIGPDIVERALPYETEIANNTIKNYRAATEPAVFSVTLARAGDDDQGARFGDAARATIDQYVEANDGAGLLAALKAGTNHDRLDWQVANLATATTHIYCALAYGDRWGSIGRQVDALATVAAATKIVNLSTGGHGTPENGDETAGRYAQRKAFFDFYAFGSTDDLDVFYPAAITDPAQADECRIAMQFGTAKNYAGDVLFEDHHAQALNSIFTAAVPTVYYPKASNVLGDTAGTGSDTTSQTWNLAYTITNWIADIEAGFEMANRLLGGGSPVLSVTPAYWENTVPAAADLYGGKVTLKWQSDAAANQLWVTLWVNGTMLSHAAFAERAHAVGGGYVTDTFYFSPMGIRLSAGDTLRIQIEPVTHNRWPYEDGDEHFEWVPIFSDYGIQVDRAGTNFELYTVASGTERVD